MADQQAIPEYQDTLGTFHDAFGKELRELVDSLPIGPGDRVIDLACGDGCFSKWLADRVGPEGLVVAVDLRLSYLDLAREMVGSQPKAAPVGFVAANVYQSPLAEGSFDLSWWRRVFGACPTRWACSGKWPGWFGPPVGWLCWKRTRCTT